MLIFDLEANGLLDDATRIHCVSVFDPVLNQKFLYHDDLSITPRDGSLLDGLKLVTRAAEICGHNVIRYDIPLIRKLFPHLAWNPEQRVFDTLVACRVIWTNLYEADVRAIRKGRLPQDFQKRGLCSKQSLEAWGERLGVSKGDFEGPWETFTQDMATYAVQDVVVTYALYTLILSKDYSDECFDIEHGAARIVARQERRGFAFNVAAAEQLYAALLKRKVELEAELQRTFLPWQAVAKVFTPKRDNRKLGYKAGVEVTKYKTVTFNPGSRDHIADRLQAIHGWEPEDFTAEGKPKVDETVLGALPYPEAKLCAAYLTVEKRCGQIGEGKEAWLKHVRAGRIHGGVNTNGAVTGRMTHSKPNVAQTPKVKADKSGVLYGEAGGWGYECRSLYHASEGLMLVGCDAEGIELRMLAHYMAKWDGGAYAEAVHNGRKEDETDVHNVNKRAVGLRLRDSAKTFIYALIYGAGDYKLGTIVYADFDDEKKARFDVAHPSKGKRQRALVKLGKSRRAAIMENLPALGKLVEAVKAQAAKKGYLRGLDGRLLHVRAAHSALNTLLQSGGAVVMKKALVLLDADLESTIRSTGATVEFVANVHDEWQMEASPEVADAVGRLAADAIVRAGAHFNLRCPLAGSYGVGKTWADTH
jgi:DNA polymerase-1